MKPSWYIGRGMRLIPLLRAEKTPAVKGGKKFCNATLDPEQVKAWGKQFPNCNWGVAMSASGLVAVDVDAKGMDEWQRLIGEHGEPQTLTQKSGSGIGRHYVFVQREGASYKQQIALGIDIKHHGYIAVQPSVHHTGGKYEWLNEDEPQVMPEWIRELCVHARVADRRDFPTTDTVTDAEYWDISELADELKDNFPTGYAEWFKVGCALHSGFAGSQRGLDLWDTITHGAGYIPGEADDTAYKWSTMTAGGGVNLGSFFTICDKYCPSRKDRPKREKSSAEDDFDSGWDAVGSKFVARSAEHVVKLLNADGWAFFTDLASAGQVRVEEGQTNVFWRRGEAFQNALAPYGHWDASGDKPKWVPAAKTWMMHRDRLTYKKVVFDHESPEGCLNQWTGIPGVPVAGDCADVLTLLEKLCGNKKRFEYMMDWCAHLVQKPHEKTSVVPVFIGTQGTGKSMFAEKIMGYIMLHTHVLLGSTDDIREQFNAEQARKFLSVLDEACWNGDEKVVARLKNLTGSEWLKVDEKFAPKYMIKNYSRYMVLSNTSRAVRIETGNRRFLVLGCKEKLEDSFFERLGGRLSDAAAAFHQVLLDRDITEFKCRVFPENIDTAGEDTKVDSMTPVGQYVYEVIMDDPIKAWDITPHGKIVLKKSEFYESYLTWQQKCGFRKPVTPNRFWEMVRDVAGEMKIGYVYGIGRCVVMTPTELRDQFIKRNRLMVPAHSVSDMDYVKNIEDFKCSEEDF